MVFFFHLFSQWLSKSIKYCWLQNFSEGQVVPLQGQCCLLALKKTCFCPWQGSVSMVYNMFSGFTALCETVVAPNGTLQQQELPAWTWRGSRDYKRSWFGSCQGFVLPPQASNTPNFPSSFGPAAEQLVFYVCMFFPRIVHRPCDEWVRGQASSCASALPFLLQHLHRGSGLTVWWVGEVWGRCLHLLGSPARAVLC